METGPSPHPPLAAQPQDKPSYLSANPVGWQVETIPSPHPPLGAQPQG
ncbi:hypothetical protein GCM10022232_53640 [Streptomyces plumbiresistens]|uniref:Uncharacterized protein n=1 Tax=Streptomyces plumbiresistens TaxID=511811 RepID=A0ABP7S5G8_9ACTN